MALNALALLAFALVPTLFGMSARAALPGLASQKRGAAGGADDAAAGVDWRARPGGGVLDRGRYLRRHSVHAVHLGIAGSTSGSSTPRRPGLDRVEDAYAETARLDRRWRTLIGLHQLHPLATHAASHGPAYAAELVATARRYR